jgi:hypothetical protein
VIVALEVAVLVPICSRITTAMSDYERNVLRADQPPP